MEKYGFKPNRLTNIWIPFLVLSCKALKPTGRIGILTPSTIRQLRIPMQMAERLDFQKIDDWQRKGEIDKILEYTDSVLLREGLGLNDDEIKMLRDIWDKLRNKRLNRNKK